MMRLFHQTLSLFSQDLRKASDTEHHEQRDGEARTDGSVQMPGRHVLHRRLHRVVPRTNQWHGEAHKGKRSHQLTFASGPPGYSAP